jgi:TonB-dependent starch-binding outer membrane protein SusC
MRRDSLFRLALFATVCLWQAGNAWGQAPPNQGQAAKKGKTRSISGTVQEADTGAPLAGATVKVSGGEATATTGADGTFTIDAPRGDVTLEVSGADHMAKDVMLAAKTKKVQVSLSKAAASGRSVTGIVKEAGTGKPVAGAVVTLKGTSVTATSDEDGLFVLQNVPAGAAQLDVASQAHTAGSIAVPDGQSTAKLELQPTNPQAAPAPAAPAPAAPTAGTRAIAGKVTSKQTGDPVPGATLMVKDTELTTIASDDGSYALDGVPAGPFTLVVIGYTQSPAEIQVPTGRRTVDVALELGSSETIVITGRAPVLMKRNLANGASVVNDEDLNRVSAQTLDAALNGKVSGANMQSNSGAPGGGTQLRLRGISTINGQSSPLYVVDGVILSNVAVASGANLITAAAAGGSASNQDNPVNRIADINPNDIENVEVLKGPAAAALYGSKAANGVVIITTKHGKPGAATKVNVTQRVGVTQVSNTLGSRRFNSMDEAIGALGMGRGSLWTPDVFDHEKEMTRTSVGFETIASATGGNDAGAYSGSILVRNEPGVVKSTFGEKQSAKVGVIYNFGDKLNVNVSSNLIHSLSDRGLTNNDNTGTSLYVALSSTPSFVDLRQNPDGTYPGNPAAASNPLQTAALLENREDVWRFIGSSSASYKLYSDNVNSVSLQGNFGADRFQQFNNLFAPPELQFEPNDGLPGTLVKATTQNLNLNVGAGAVWTLSPKSGAFKSALSGGFTYEYVDLDTVAIQAQNLNAGQSNVDAAAVVNTAENHLRTEEQGGYVQEEVSLLNDSLTLLAGVLAERSSLNGDDSKFWFFPKAGVTYKLPVLEDLFNPLRVRASYGEAGNRPNYGQKFSPLNATATIGGNPGLVIGGIGGLLTAGDPNIEPERQREVELGVDAAMEDQRVVLELTGYQRNISNMLLQRTLAPSDGITTLFENGGSMRNRGVEVSLQVIPIMNPVEWTTRANLTLNRSKVTDLPGEAFDLNTVGFGAGLGAFRIEKGKSVTQLVSDVDGDGIEDVVGNGEPDFRVGWSNELKFGDFGVFGLLDWQKGSEIVNLTRYLYDAGGVAPDPEAAAMRQDTINNGDIRPYIESATFVKIREVSLYYNVPEKFATQLGPLNSMRLSLSGRNLATFTDYSGLDPEVSNFGNQPIGRNYDVAPYPPSRSYWLSIDAGF